MSSIAECPKCHKKYKNVLPEHVGIKTTCKKCNSKFVVQICSTADENALRREGLWKVGDLILRKYKVTDILGIGGMGAVHKVYHLNWQMDLAVKSPNSLALRRAKGKTNFLKEAETWVNLGMHQNVVNCYYVREIDGIPRVFSEYVNGGSLKEWIREGRLTTLDTMLDAAIQVAWGLHYAHTQGLVHQDVKPANVMMTNDGVAKIADFGLAKSKPMTESDYMEPDSQSAIDIEVTYRGMTPAFCSPEQSKKRKLTIATDVWSWGLCVLQIFAGKVTWRSGTEAMKALDKYLAPKADQGPIAKMPSPIVWLLRDCFNNNPSKRPKNLQKAAEALQLIYYDKLGVKYPREFPASGVDSSDSYNNRALSLLDLGRKPEAMDTWKRAIAQQPFHLESNYNSCLVRWRDGAISYEAMVKRLNDEKLKSDENKWLHKYLLGLAFLEKGDDTMAVKAFESISEAAGDNKEVSTALEFAKNRKLDKFTAPFRLSAIKKIERIFATESEFKSVMTLVQKAMSENNLNQAVTHIKQARAMPNFNHRSEAMNAWTTLYSMLPHKSFVNAWEEEVLDNQQGCINVVAFSPNGRYLLAGGDSGLTIWDLSSGKPSIRAKHEGQINSARFSSDSEFVLAGGKDNQIIVWDVLENEESFRLPKLRSDISAVDICQDMRLAVSGCADGSLKLWDTQEEKLIKNIGSLEHFVASVLFSVDSKHIYALPAAGALRGFETHSDKRQLMFDKHSLHASTMDISSDGELMVFNSGRTRTGLMIGNLLSGEIVQSFDECEAQITACCFCFDKQFALSGSVDGKVTIWDVSEGRAIKIFKAHKKRVTALAVMRNGRRFATASADGSVSIWQIDWDLATGEFPEWRQEADTYLKNFLSNSMPYAPNIISNAEPSDSQKIKMTLTKELNPSWDAESYKRLLYDLGCAGYGYLNKELIKEKLTQHIAEIRNDAEHLKKDFANYTIAMKMKEKSDQSKRKVKKPFSALIKATIVIALVAIAFWIFSAYGLLDTNRNETIEQMKSAHGKLYGSTGFTGKASTRLLNRLNVEQTDVWGTDYRVNIDRDKVTIQSAGPDLIFDTEDDIVVKGDDINIEIIDGN